MSKTLIMGTRDGGLIPDGISNLMYKTLVNSTLTMARFHSAVVEEIIIIVVATSVSGDNPPGICIGSEIFF